MNANVNAINWFEISVADIDRATKFYETVFNIQMERTQMLDMEMAFFPFTPGNGKVSGGLVKGEMHRPSADGAKIYFNGDPDLSDALSRVEAAGGKVIMPKTLIDEQTGYMAFFIDTEGNVVAMHSNG